MQNSNYEKLLQKYKKLLSEGKVCEANKLKFDIVMMSIGGVI